MNFAQAHNDHLDPEKHDRPIHHPPPNKWVMFTKRTDDPKLAWMEKKLAEMGIESRRNGESFHAPILEVRRKDLARACAWLSTPFDGEPDPKTGKSQTIDDVPDDDPSFIG